MPPVSLDVPFHPAARSPWAAILLAFLAACGGNDLALGTGNRGAPGEDGPYGTHVTRTWMLQGASSRPVTVVEPVDIALDGMPLPRKLPAVVLVHGGLVAPARYTWLAEHLASRGYVVILPSHVAWLSLLDGSVVPAAVKHLEAMFGDRLGVLAVGGHSLGGVSASKAALQDDRFKGLFMLASQADDADDVTTLGYPVLAIAGTEDDSQPLETAREKWGRFSSGWLAVVTGLTHFSWTSEGTDPTTLRETEPAPANLAAVRRGALWALDAYLDGVVLGDSSSRALLGNNSTPPAGVVVESR